MISPVINEAKATAHIVTRQTSIDPAMLSGISVVLDCLWYFACGVFCGGRKHTHMHIIYIYIYIYMYIYIHIYIYIYIFRKFGKQIKLVRVPLGCLYNWLPVLGLPL